MLEYTICAQLRAQRIAQGVSIRKCAADAGIDKVTLQRMEAGQGSPSLSNVEKVADVLGYDVTLTKR